MSSSEHLFMGRLPSPIRVPMWKVAWRCFVTVMYCLSITPLASAQGTIDNFEITRKIVVFIYVKDAQGVEKPDGTGFLLAVPLRKAPNNAYVILVTARHMVDPGWIGCPSGGELIAKLNKTNYDPQKPDTGTVEYPLKDQHWIFPDDDSVDIAYTLLDGKTFEALGSENLGIGISNLPSKSELGRVKVGDQIVSAGLLVATKGQPNAQGQQEFVDALSNKRNYPIFKFGNISSIPAEKVAVPGCGNTTRLMTEWMVAANLVPGNSGSPIVFTPPELHSSEARLFLLGVQSISFLGSDVAGMAPSSYLMDSIRRLPLEDADLSKPADDASPTTKSTPTNVPQSFPIKPSSVSTPNLK